MSMRVESDPLLRGYNPRGYGRCFGGTEFPRSRTERAILQAAETLLRSGITTTGPKGAKLVGECNGIKIAVINSYDGVTRGKIKSIYLISATR